MVAQFVLRAFNGYDTDQASLETGVLCEDPSLAQQHQREEADINTIVRRFGISGVLPQARVLPTFEDFDEIFDFRTAQDAILAANAAFKAYPADLRFRFQNDPQKFVEFCSDPANLPELRRLGLAPEAPEAPNAEVAPKARDGEDVIDG